MSQPETIGRYRILREVAQGGMGTVYLAEDPHLRRQVAIKVLRAAGDQPELRQRFVREAQAAASLRHPNIVSIFDVGEEAGTLFIVMEHVAGSTLADIIGRRVAMPLPRKLRIIQEVCAA